MMFFYEKIDPFMLKDSDMSLSKGELRSLLIDAFEKGMPIPLMEDVKIP